MSQQQLDYATPMPARIRFAWVRSKRFRQVALFIAVAGLCYIGTYALLSKFGRYEASSLKFDEVDWYQWAPAGFVHNYRRRDGLFYVFLPLYLADRAFWHTDDDAWRGRYARHDPENIGELERAWRR